MKRDDENLDEILDRYLPSATSGEMEVDGDRVWSRLRSRAEESPARRMSAATPAATFGHRRLFAVLAAAAVLLLAFVGIVSFQRKADAFATVESADGLVYRASNVAYVGAEVRSDESLRSDGVTMLALADGSRVEMRSRSELSLERTGDGLRIHLRNGGIIVNAAKQSAGRHLYVRTRDMTVSVVGTVFLVNAEEEGSRVSVIEGEVRVQQGESEKSLRSGQQVTTNPAMKPRPVTEEIAWSRRAAALMAQLQQSTPASAPLPVREVFDVASVRPTALSHGGERGAGGGGGRRSLRPADEPCGEPSTFLKFDPSRVAITDMTVYGLLSLAQGVSCRPHYGSDFLVGGPSWVRTDGYDIQANIPTGPPAYTEKENRGGFGRTYMTQEITPRFQKMLGNLLEDRFNLVLKKETREMPAYILSIAKGGPKLTPWKEGDPLCLGDCNFYGAFGGSPEYILGQKQTMTSLADMLKVLTGRTIIDRTGLTDEYNFSVSFAWFDTPFGPPRPAVERPREPGSPPRSDVPLVNAFEQTLGLKLEAVKMPMEVTVIERVDRPSEN